MGETKKRRLGDEGMGRLGEWENGRMGEVGIGRLGEWEKKRSGEKEKRKSQMTRAERANDNE